MENLIDEFNEIENKEPDKIEDLINKINSLVDENEKLVEDSEKRKASQNKKEEIQEEISQLSSEQYEQLLKHIENWGYETAFKLSGGSPTITMKTTTLAELFKSIYIAGTKGE